MRKFLFVCTGNIFRSMVAEYALKQLLTPELKACSTSAGTVAAPQSIAPVLVEILQTRSIDVTPHCQRKLTAQLLADRPLVIAMSTDHQAFIRENFQVEARLFNELCYDCSSPILDLGEAYPDWKNTPPKVLRHYLAATVDLICAGVPKFMEHIR